MTDGLRSRFGNLGVFSGKPQAAALAKLKVPKMVALQLLLTARYLGTLADEASRMCRAYALRSPSHPKIRMRHFPHMLVSLLLRSADRADGIFAAMQNRGFTEIPARTGRIRIAELAAAAFGRIGEILADTRLLLDCGLA